LSEPVLDVTLERNGNKTCKVGVASMQGYRCTMEDTHIVSLSLPSNKERSGFGVFDGHGGSKAAEYSAKHFNKYIDEIKNLKSEDIREALMKMDAEFMSEFEDDSGCTATFAIVEPSQQNKNEFIIAIGNVGDSRSLLIKKTGDMVYCTHDHKPDDFKEKNRIINAKGCVFRHRVGGCLAISRAIGDKEFKHNSELPPELQQVIAMPDVATFTAEEGDILILCCDGIFEAMTNAKLVKFVMAALKDNNDLAVILNDLLVKCVQISRDNMTAMIVQFINGENYSDNSNVGNA